MSHTSTRLSFGHGATTQTDPALALQELDAQLHFDDCDAVILFVSSLYDLDRLQDEIRLRIHVPLLCSTTAGEISSEIGYTDGGMVAATISGCSARLIAFSDIRRDPRSIERALSEARGEIETLQHESNTIGVAVLDGLCRREESIIELLQSAMPTIPIVGGSAGDACKFRKTLVYVNGFLQAEAGALLLLSGDFTAIPFQTHHFTSSGNRLVATQVDVANRRVICLDGLPATTRLAEILGCRAEEVTAERLATKPLMLRIGDVYFVRSVHAMQADGGISLLCAIHEGEILHLGKPGEIVDITAAYFDALSHQNSTPDLVLGFDCILRRLELSLRGLTAEINEVIKSVPFIGFSTFGEQFNGQHVNQTMTGVALWKR